MSDSKIAWTENCEKTKYPQNEKVKINVSGQLFVTTKQTLASRPDTTLGRLVTEGDNSSSADGYFFDADDEVFREVLRYYRTGALHMPKNICYETFITELEYWGIDEGEIARCCQTHDQSVEELEKQFEWFEKRIIAEGKMSWRHKIWYFMTDPLGPYTEHRSASAAYAVVYNILIALQAVNIGAFTLPSKVDDFAYTNTTSFTDLWIDSFKVPCNASKDALIQMAPGGSLSFLVALQLFFTWVMFADTVVRFICCPVKKRFFTPLNTMGVIISVYETCVSTALMILSLTEIYPESSAGCKTLTVMTSILFIAVQLKVFNLLATVTAFGEMRVLILAIYNSRKEIALLLVVMGIASLLGGSALYYTEVLGTFIPNPEPSVPLINNVFLGYWWAVVTMTTVGYGDYYPVTALGYGVTSLVMILGLMLTALPIAIVGGNFAILYEYHQKREHKKMLQSSQKPRVKTEDSK